MDNDMNGMNNTNNMNGMDNMNNPDNMNNQNVMNNPMDSVNSTLNAMKEMDRNNINNTNIMNNPEFMNNIGNSNNMNTTNVNGNNFRNMNGSNLNGNTNIMNTVNSNQYSDRYVEFKEPVAKKKVNIKLIAIIAGVVFFIILLIVCFILLLTSGKKTEPKKKEEPEVKDTKEYGVVNAEEKQKLENRKKIVEKDVSKVEIPGGITKEEIEDLWMQFKEDYGEYYWTEIAQFDESGNEMISITNDLKTRLNNVIRTFNSGDYYKIKCSDVEEMVDSKGGVCGYVEGDALTLDKDKNITNTQEELNELLGSRNVYALDAKKVKEKYDKYYSEDIHNFKRIHYDSKVDAYIIYNKVGCVDSTIPTTEGKYHKLDSVVLNGSQLVLNSYTVTPREAGGTPTYSKVVYIFKRDNKKEKYLFSKRDVKTVQEKQVPTRLLEEFNR